MPQSRRSVRWQPRPDAPTDGARRRSNATTLLLAMIGALGCGGGAQDTTTPQSKPVDTSTLVGTWVGRVEGGNAANSYGSGNIVTVLKADSTVTTSSSDNPLYCLAAGTWTVAAGQYSSVSRDCTGTILTSTAPVNALRLTGTWTATSGRAGTFSIAKT